VPGRDMLSLHGFTQAPGMIRVARANGTSTLVAAHVEIFPWRTSPRISSGSASIRATRLATQLLSRPSISATLAWVSPTAHREAETAKAHRG